VHPENELEEVAKEFEQYRKKVQLWYDAKEDISYSLNGNEKIMRVVGVNEPQVFYG